LPDISTTLAQSAFSLVEFVRQLLGLEGPAAVVCTAFVERQGFRLAQRLIAAGLIDAAVVGGADSLCLTTLYGFHSLQLLSPTACRPFDVTRDGISIGEAAAFVLLERAPASLDAESVLLAGVGESSDAYHVQSASQGRGAAEAMSAALSAAALRSEEIDTSICGTGTGPTTRRAWPSARWSAIQCRAVPPRAQPAMQAPQSAGAVIAALSLQLLHADGVNTTVIDPTLATLPAREQAAGRLRISNDGFGGSCALLVRRTEANRMTQLIANLRA
jgi:3-oxoacyl-[acyl-carrier-protein] synthase-1